MDYHGSNANDVINQAAQGIAPGGVIYGEGGDDTITADWAIVVGGAGNDTIIATSAATTVAYWGSPGAVVVNLQTGVARDGYGTLDTLVGVRNVQGTGFDDVFIGSAADESFYGGGGNDRYAGGGGNDTVNYFFQPSTAATVSYDAPTDTFTVHKHFANGDNGTDTLTGISAIAFTGAGSDATTLSRANYVGDFRAAIASALQTAVPAGASLQQFKVGDFNGDGIADLAIVTQVGTGTAAGPTLVLLGDGHGGYADASATVFAAGALSNAAGGGRTLTGDFNHDGITDLFQLNFGNDAPPFVGGLNGLYLSNAATGKLVDASATLQQTASLNHGGSVGDVNGDGFPDILVDTLDKGNVLLINDGSGHFLAHPELLPHPQIDLGYGAQPQTNTFSGIIDVNGDGHADLIIGKWDGSTSTPTTEVLLNDGSGNFSLATPLALPASGVAREIILDVKAIDLNGDGRPDLMLSVTNGGTADTFYRTPYIELLINDGGGHFHDETAARLPQALAADSGWYMALTSVDFNHDGFPDILASSAGGAVKSTVYLNRGDGTFALDWQGVAGDSAVAIDANGDGMSDVATASTAGVVSVFTSVLANGHVYKANFGGDQLLGSAGNDVFYTRDGADAIDGGAGIDTVVIGATMAQAAVTHAGAVFHVALAAGTASLSNVERVQFSDGALALDIAGDAGQAYRIYQAAFNRAPDAAGLGYWMAALDHGASLSDVAAGFVASAEFQTTYGAGSSNSALLTRIYQNVLHRAGDAAGFNYWLNLLDTHAATPAQVLAGFSESLENQAALIGVISNGIAYTPYGSL